MAGSSAEHLPVDPAQTRSRVRQHWTRQMNIGLINAYYEITEGETKTKKYADQLAERWRNIYPDKVFTGKHLIAQIRNIKTRKLLAPDELEALKTRAMDCSPAANIRNIRRSLQRRSSIRPQQIRYEEGDETGQIMELGILDEAAKDILPLFQEIRLKWEGTAFGVRPRISRLKNNPETRNLVQLLDAALKDTIQASTSLEELCHVVYSAAITANTIQQTASKIGQRGNNLQGKPPWEKRLEGKIERIRKEIGILHAFLSSQRPSKKLEKKVREYSGRAGLKRKETDYRMKLKTHLEMLKQKIAALGNRIRRYHKRTLRFRQNNLFSNNQKEFYRGLEMEKAGRTDPPTSGEMAEYWSKVWSRSTSHNENAAWIKAEEEQQSDLQEMDAVHITEENICVTVKRMKNWTAPGVDGIHNYWWKALKSTHRVLSRLIQGALEQPQSVPEYLTQGITYMIPKKGDLKKPENYRPITSLSSIYKIITSIISHQIDTHLKRNNIMAWEQNGCKNKSKGSKELLIIDKTITRQAKIRKKNISMAWIDYQKAYDSVPHSWLLKVLEIYKVNKRIIHLLRFLMSTWRTTITISGQSTPGHTVKIRRGIFQGDGFSPRWFCLALNILSKVLNRSAYGYSMNESVKLSHLFYMDDIKLYARGRKQLEGEIELVRRFSEDIGMSFGLEKCAVVEVKRGKMVAEGNIRLADGREIAELAMEERYKNLGIQQTYEIKQTENKQNVKTELMTRVHR
ncbi:uncharacterized protein LOC123307002 [Coccinella septempunctata]|uniref:uncharacterized protein LOC123307002 n=1 Tax=Coccinella septempunctata TaxID=41139 RepID=UPI001D092745|nr:uncharacterized protein LOC123307002 [Coccinella septempunctata]